MKNNETIGPAKGAGPRLPEVLLGAPPRRPGRPKTNREAVLHAVEPGEWKKPRPNSVSEDSKGRPPKHEMKKSSPGRWLPTLAIRYFPLSRCRRAEPRSFRKSWNLLKPNVLGGCKRKRQANPSSPLTPRKTPGCERVMGKGRGL